jgi:hypothetical protein
MFAYQPAFDTMAAGTQGFFSAGPYFSTGFLVLSRLPVRRARKMYLASDTYSQWQFKNTVS